MAENLGEESLATALATKSVLESPNLAVLNGPLNGKVYVIGTAHFSLESQQEVIELIKQVRPDCVVLELCAARTNILSLDEEEIIRDAEQAGFRKMIQTIKSNVSERIKPVYGPIKLII